MSKPAKQVRLKRAKTEERGGGGKPRAYYEVSSPNHETVSIATFGFISPLSSGNDFASVNLSVYYAPCYTKTYKTRNNFMITLTISMGRRPPVLVPVT
jgi:hypothetical protein